MVKKLEKPVLMLGTVSLTSAPIVIQEKFKAFDKRLIYANDIRDFEVNTDESCNIAEMKIKDVIALEKEIELVETVLKTPLNYLKNGVLALSKKRKDILADTKNILSKKVTNHRNLKVAQLQAAQKAKEREGLKVIAEKTGIVERVARIIFQLRALLMGGNLVNKLGEFIPVAAPESIERLDEINTMMEKSFPNYAEFDEFKDEIITIHQEFKEDLGFYKDHLDDEVWLKILKIKYDKLYEKYTQYIEKVEATETKKVEKEIKAEIKDASKGLREWTKFSVTNFELLPDNYKVTNETAIRQYIKDNKERVDNLIKEGKSDSIIPGIDFRIERTHVIS